MAQIHIGRGTTNLGVFTEDEVREGLHTGQFLPNDLGWITGMENWKPLSDFPQLTPTPPAFPDLEFEENLPRLGLPWDDRDSIGVFPAFLGTIRLVLMEPVNAFSMMQRQGGLGGPLLFALTSGWIGGGAALFYNFIFQMLLNQSTGTKPLPPGIPTILSGEGMTTSIFIVMLIFLPAFLAASIFIASGIIHFFLLFLGGAKQPFETTVRVVCFSVGATALLQLLPICGGITFEIWNIVLQCIGISKAHETSTGKSVATILGLCCCRLFFVIITVASFFK